MENGFKKVNEKKFKNKQRYKQHSRKGVSNNHNVKQNKSSSDNKCEEELPKNWSKYETSYSDEEFAAKANFDNFLDKPLSQASFFKFKNEENWSKTVELHSQFQKYFTLDVNLLTAGISCVEFSERYGLKDKLLTTLDVNTDNAKTAYETYLNKIKPKQSIDKQETEKLAETSQEKLSEDKLSQKVPIELKFNNINIDAFENKIVTKIIDDDEKVKASNPCEDLIVQESIIDDPLMVPTIVDKMNLNKSNTSEDLEQWLDDILDN